MNRIETVIQDILAKKYFATRIFEGTTVDNGELDEWERSNGYKLPSDYRQFMQSIGRCNLNGIGKFDHDYSVRIMTLAEVQSFSISAFGHQMDEIPESWFAFADAQDGNFIVMDLKSLNDDTVNIIDGCWECARSGPPIIAKSFTEFVEHSLIDSQTSSGWGDVARGIRYWSTPGCYYGDTPTPHGRD